MEEGSNAMPEMLPVACFKNNKASVRPEGLGSSCLLANLRDDRSERVQPQHRFWCAWAPRRGLSGPVRGRKLDVPLPTTLPLHLESAPILTLPSEVQSLAENMPPWRCSQLCTCCYSLFHLIHVAAGWVCESQVVLLKPAGPCGISLAVKYHQRPCARSVPLVALAHQKGGARGDANRVSGSRPGKKGKVQKVRPSLLSTPQDCRA